MDVIQNAIILGRNRLRSRLARNVTIAVVSTALAQGIIVLISPILTRLYTPTDLGILAVYNSTLIILSVLTSLRYELTIPLPNEEDTAINLLTLSMILLPVTAAIVAIIIFLSEENIVQFLNEPGLRPFLSWLAPGLIIIGAYQALTYWFLRKRDFRPIATTKTCQSVIQAISHIILGMMTGGALSLIVGLLLGYLVGGLWFVFLIWKQNRDLFSLISFKKMWLVAVQYKNFPLISSGSAILNNVGIQLPIYIISLCFDSHIVGLFALTQRVINVPINVLSSSVGQVFTSEASYLASKSSQDLLSLFDRMTKRLFFLSLLPAIIFALIGPPLFSIIFGQEWRDAGLYSSLLMPLIIARFVVSPVGQVFNVLEKLNFQLIWDMARFIILLLALILAASTGDATLTVATYSITLTVLYALLYIVYRRVISNLGVVNG